MFTKLDQKRILALRLLMFLCVAVSLFTIASTSYSTPVAVSLTDILRQAEAADCSKQAFRADLRVVFKNSETGEPSVESEGSIIADGNRYKLVYENKIFQRDSFSESSSISVRTKDEYYRISGTLEDGKMEDPKIRIYPHDDPEESQRRQSPLVGLWALSSVMHGDTEPYYALFRNNPDKVHVSEVKINDRELIEVSASLPQGEYLVRLDPSIKYKIVYSKTEKRVERGHFLLNNEIPSEDRTKNGPSYSLEGELSIVEVQYESTGVPKSASLQYTTDTSNWPDGISANKELFELEISKFEYLKGPLSDDVLKVEWPDSALVFDHAKGTKRAPVLGYFENGILRETPLPKVGEKAPSFEAVDFEGNRVSLEQFRGKYVVVDIWATWCSPCRNEHPMIERDWVFYNPKNVVFLGVSVDKDGEKAKQYIADAKLTSPQMWDTGEWKAKIMLQYGASQLPTNLLIDPEGNLIGMTSGYLGIRKQVLEILAKEK